MELIVDRLMNITDQRENVLFILVNDDVIAIHDKLLKFGFNPFISVYNYNYLMQFFTEIYVYYYIYSVLLLKKMIALFLYLSTYEDDTH